MQDEKMKQSIPAEKTKPRKKPGRQPMTPEQKAEAAKARAEEKAKAANLKPEVFVQFQERDTAIDALVEAAKADFHKAKKRTLVKSMKLYIKPEEHMAYYVINEIHEGKVAL